MSSPNFALLVYKICTSDVKYYNHMDIPAIFAVDNLCRLKKRDVG